MDLVPAPRLPAELVAAATSSDLPRGTSPSMLIEPPAPQREDLGTATSTRAGTRRRSGSPTAAALLTLDLTVLLLCVVKPDRPALLAGGVTALLLLAQARMYRERLTLSVLDDLPALVRAVLGGTGAAVLAAGASSSALASSSLATAALALAGLTVARAAVYAGVRFSRRRGLLRRTLLVGCGDLGGRIATLLRDHPEHGLEPVGFVDEKPLLPPDQRPVPLVGRLRDLPTLLRKTEVDVVVVGYGVANETAVVDVLRTCDRLPVEVLVVPRLFELHSRSGCDEWVRGLPLVHLRRPAFRAPTWPLKRAMDVVVAGVALLLAAPVMAVCALAVRVEGGPGVLFRQERVGLDGRRFELLKFRSMQPACAEESGTRWSIAGDNRVGPVGRRLRSSSLDELPQLWNVLRGDMSLVGPRPERPHFVASFSLEHEEYAWRHRVPVGVTGWAQVNGLRGDTPIAERARYDNDYIENWSLWWDVRILVTTLRALRGGS